jgi:hypothetical protein
MFNKGRIDVNEGQVSGDFDIHVMGSKPRTALINGRIDDTVGSTQSSFGRTPLAVVRVASSSF